LWNKLRSFSNGIQEPWLFGRDFYNVMAPNERIERSALSIHEILALKDCAQDCELLDLTNRSNISVPGTKGKGWVLGYFLQLIERQQMVNGWMLPWKVKQTTNLRGFVITLVVITFHRQI